MRKIKIKEFTLDSSKAICLNNGISNTDYKVDNVKLYNTVFSTAYDITEKNISNILEDIDWQSVVNFGVVCIFIFPSYPSTYAVNLFYKMKTGKAIHEVLLKDGSNMLEIANHVVDLILNEEDKVTKFIVFRAILDISAMILSYTVSYAMGDKNIEDELKNKIMPV